MNKKIKNIVHRCIGLILVMSIIIPMIMPSTVFAGTYTVKDWNEYREKLKNGIMNQEESIIINFNGSEIFTSENMARIKIENEFKEALSSTPYHLGELNITNKTIVPVLDETTKVLKSVTHQIEYKYIKQDFDSLRANLNEQYNIIKIKFTDYEKIKYAYDFIVGALSNVEGKEVSEIKGIFIHKQDDKDILDKSSYTILFAMMMDELGYDNDIAIGKVEEEGSIWNLVKVQGLWYHVDGRQESIEDNVVSDKCFLILKDKSIWNFDRHRGKVFADEKYVGSNPTVQQLIYEIELIKKDIDKTINDIKNISEDTPIEKIKESKQKLITIEEKKKNYDELKDILKSEVDKYQDGTLSTAFEELEGKIDDLTNKILKKKESIVIKAVTKAEKTFQMNDILAAKESITMIANKDLEERINALEAAVAAIQKAERTKSEEDIILAKDAVKIVRQEQRTELEERIKILEATIAVEKAERTKLLDDIEKAFDSVDNLKEGETKTNLKDRIKALQDEIDDNEKEQKLINEVKEIVEEIESNLRNNKIEGLDDKINDANAAIENIKTESIKKQLQGRIDNVKIAVDAIKSINNADDSIKNIPVEDTLDPQDSLISRIDKSEEFVKVAEQEIKKIKDMGVRTNQQNRIKAIKLVITAMKAVEKAETAIPLKMTYVTSSRKAIDNISKDYQTEINTLNARLDRVESAIDSSDLVTKAVKAVEKAEKSMKDIDIALAREAVKLLPDGIIKDDLNNRIDATAAMGKTEVCLAKYLREYSETNKTELQNAVDIADTAINKLKESIVKTQRISRMTVIKKAKLAIELIEDVKKTGSIEDAETAIADISDSKIKKELEKKLKDIISMIDTDKKIENAEKAVNEAITSLTTEGTLSSDNILAVKEAEEAVKNLPTSNIKKEFQATIKELNNAIKAKQTVENAEIKAENGTLTAKDVTAAEKALLNINPDYKPGLDDRVNALRAKLEKNEAADLLKKAKEAVKKAEETKLSKDITAAKKAIDLVKDQTEKDKLTEEIETLEVSIAENLVKYAEESALHNSKTLSKDITTAKNAVAAISNKAEYRDKISNLNARIRALESYVQTIKVLENAEKNRNEINKNAAGTALEDFKSIIEKIADEDKTIYEGMISDISSRIKAIEDYLKDEGAKVTEAEEAVLEAEGEMKKDSEPSNETIQKAQKAIDKVTDKKLRASLQKRLDAIQIAKDAKAAVARAEAYPTEKSVKDAETALNKVDGRYKDIIEHLGKIIADLKNQLDISKKVAEATKLVEKAVESRIAADSIKARFAVDELKDLAEDSYNRLKKILDDLDQSIGEEEINETEALKAANEALNDVFKIIDETNTFISKIIEGADDETDKIKAAYEMIDDAKNQVIKANAAVRKLSNQKDLLAQIDYANEEIELSEDNIDVKEAVRLVNIASYSVDKAKDEQGKSQARLDIAAARRAIDRIGHNKNKDIKKTILNTINAIEGKLITDNDQELIDLAVKAVNDAADLLAESIRKGNVMNEQEKIDKVIFAAKMAIGWISDNNKAAKDTLTGFLNDIDAMYKAEKEGILNEERIKNAENAVEAAEEKYRSGSDELESYIRIARLRVKIIINDGPDTKAKIDELNARLDAIEGKGSGGSGGNNGGGSGNGGNDKPGTGGNKPGGSNSPGNIIPTTPLPNNKRIIGVTEPEWGKTKELKKTIPTTGIPTSDAAAFRIYESKLKITELSNILKTTKNANTRLVVRGKNVTLDTKLYIYDSINNSILLPVKTIGDELGFSVSLINGPGTKRLLLNGVVYGETKSIIMDIGSEHSYINGSLVNLPSKPVIMEGRAYIPVDFMVEHLGLNFSYYNDGGSIQLLIN